MDGRLKKFRFLIFDFRLRDKRMEQITNLVVTSGLALLLCGCMHTVTSGGAPSPDKRYSLCMANHGASGKAYVAFGKKRVFISIWKEPSNYMSNDGQELFSGKYVFGAADLCEATRWRGSNEVAVYFFDYGDGVSSYDAKAGSPSNYIWTLAFVLDTGT